MNYTNQQITDLIWQVARAAAEETVKELKKNGMLEDADKAKIASEELSKYYQDGETDERMAKVLHQLRSDEYIRLIPMYFGEGFTTEHIAEVFGVEVSTISRNKKRLCVAIYKLMERSER